MPRASGLSVRAQCIKCLGVTVQYTYGLGSSLGFSVLSRCSGVRVHRMGASCFRGQLHKLQPAHVNP